MVIGESVYVGGGSTGSGRGELSDFVVFRFDLAKKEWSTLPPCSVICFGLVHFTSELVLVGGRELGGNVSSQVCHFKMDTHTWEQFIPPMTTPRMAPCMTATQSALVVARGMSIDVMSLVEVYSTVTSQWYRADPFPLPCAFATSAAIGNTWYILGGFLPGFKPSKVVLSAPVDSLVQKATSDSKHKSPSIWKKLPDTHFCGTTVASFGNHLLSVGGFDAKGTAGHAIYVYAPHSNSWVKVTKLPVPREGCTAVELPDKKLFVVGGKDTREKNTSTTVIGSLVTH